MGSHCTRRDFLSTSAALVAGTALAGALPRTFAHAGGSDRLRVAVIGCGGRGTGAAIQALAADRGAVLVAMADVFAHRIASSLQAIDEELKRRISAGEAEPEILERVRVPTERQHVGFDGYLEALAECDVALLAAPPHFRPAHLHAAVEAGAHVFCEKPVAVDAPGVRSVLASAEKAQGAGLALVSGFCWRYSAKERETYRRVHEGGIGDLRAVYTTYNAGGWVAPKARREEWSDLEFQLRNWHYFNWLSGDHLVEQACHSIDKIAWAMNGRLPTRCTGVGGRQARPQTPETGNVYDHFALTYEYADGARAFHMCRHFPGCPSDNSDFIMGTRGTCTVNGWSGVHRIDGEDPWRCQTPGNDMYQQEHDELFASIRAGRPINDGVWMSHSTLMAIMGRLAAYTGQVVTWEQALDSREDFTLDRYEWRELPVAPVAVPGQTKLI